MVQDKTSSLRRARAAIDIIPSALGRKSTQGLFCIQVEFDTAYERGRIARELLTRNFQASDAIRNELALLGIIVEITKDGARWKRK